MCPELDVGLEDKKLKMSEGGRRGGKSTYSQNRVARATLDPRLKPLSGYELSGGELNRDEKRFLGAEITTEEVSEWNADYDNAPEAIDAYLIASNGALMPKSCTEKMPKKLTGCTRVILVPPE